MLWPKAASSPVVQILWRSYERERKRKQGSDRMYAIRRNSGQWRNIYSLAKSKLVGRCPSIHSLTPNFRQPRNIVSHRRAQINDLAPNPTTIGLRMARQREQTCFFLFGEAVVVTYARQTAFASTEPIIFHAANLRGLPYMTSAKFSIFFTPSPHLSISIAARGQRLLSRLHLCCKFLT